MKSFDAFGEHGELFRKNTFRTIGMLAVSGSFIFVLLFIFILILFRLILPVPASGFTEFFIILISGFSAFLVSAAGIFYNIYELRAEHLRQLMDMRARLYLQDLMLNNENEIHYYTDKNGSILWVSEGIVHLLGYHPSQVIGKPLTAYYFDSSRRRQFQEAMEQNNGVVTNYEEMMLHRNGSVIWVSTDARYYYTDHGEIAGIAGSARDITSQKIALENLRENELLFRLVSENSPAGIMIYDFETRIIYANPVFCRLTGYSQEELLRLTVWDLIHPEITPMVRANLEKRFKGDRNVIIYDKFRLIKKNGETATVSLRSQGVEYKRRFAVFVQCSEEHGKL